MTRVFDDVCFSEAAHRFLVFKLWRFLALPEKVELYRALASYSIAGASL